MENSKLEKTSSASEIERLLQEQACITTQQMVNNQRDREKALVDVIKNFLGTYDTPVGRKYNTPFQEEVIKDANETLARLGIFKPLC